MKKTTEVKKTIHLTKISGAIVEALRHLYPESMKDAAILEDLLRSAYEKKTGKKYITNQ